MKITILHFILKCGQKVNQCAKLNWATTMKYLSLPGGTGSNGNSRWRFKSTTVKAFVLCLFGFSALFITYQLIYYVNLTEYQSQESQSRQFALLHKNSDDKPVIAEVEVVEDGLVPKDDSLVVIGGITGDNHRGGGGARKKGKPLVSLTGGRLIGVKPTDLHLYQDQQLNDRIFFQCFDTHKKITWEKVNDDYCDCPLDGSDEPSTSACLSGKFYCLRRDETKG